MILISILLIVFCCLIIWRASDGFEAASEHLGRGMSEGVRGATINAIGSSMPELFTTLFFLFLLKDTDGFAGGIGTTAGSAIFNGMIIPAVVILVVVMQGVSRHVEVSRKVILRDGLSLLACEFVLIFLLGGDALNWWHGAILMGLYAAYVTFMLTSMKRQVDAVGEVEVEVLEEEEKVNSGRRSLGMNLITLNLEPIFVKDRIGTWSAWSMLLFSMLIIGGACMLLVKSCEWLGGGLSVPIYFVALILASAATSVPDTILSMKDAKKGNYDDAVSNALGSNIFDVCFALGFPLFLFTLIFGPIHMNPETVLNVSELRILLFLLTIVAFIIYIAKPKMGLSSAVMLLGIYLGFTAYIMGRALGWEWSDGIAEGLREINEVINGFR